MNAPFDTASANLSRFDSALQDANLWRGECIQQFAELELTIGNALQILGASKAGSKIKTRNLVRPAFDELKRLTGTKGAFNTPGRSVAKSLDEIDRLIEWRAHLTHGVLGVWQGSKGQWLLTFQHREAGDNRPVRFFALPKNEADQILRRLTGEVYKLKSRVGSMRGALKAA